MRVAVFFLFTILTMYANSQTRWTFQTGGRVYSTPAVSEELVFAGSADSCIYALNRTSGELRWKYFTGGAVRSGVVIAGDMVLAASSNGNLYALKAADGSLKWKFTSHGEKMLDLWDYYLSDAVIHQDKVFWGSGDGNLYALDLLTGNPLWSYNSGAMIHATPTIFQDKVYTGNYNGDFFALSVADGALQWKFRTIGDTYFPNGEIQRGACVDNGIVYFGSRDYNIYALNATTGRGHWNMKEQGSWIIATPLVHNDNLFFGTSDTHSFYCLNKTDGKIKWKIPVPMRVYGTAAVHNNTVYFGCFDGRLYGVDASTGERVWQYSTRGNQQNYSTVFNEDEKFIDSFRLYGDDYLASEEKIHNLGAILSSPVISNNTVYFGSSDGAIYAVSLTD